MTEKSALPIWAEDIHREIPNGIVAQRLVFELNKLTEILRPVVVEYKSGPHLKQSKQADADARDELKRLHRQAEKLRDSLQAIGTKPKTMVAKQLAELFIDDEREIREGIASFESLSALVDDLDPMIRLLDETTKHVKTSPGFPRDKLRESLIRIVARIFRQVAPDIEVSQKPISLFYRVVDQYLMDLDVDSGNLNRTLNRLISEGSIA